MKSVEHDDLREFISACQKVSDWREIRGAQWDLELGALIEATAEGVEPPPLLLFDEIQGYPRGFRVVALLLASHRRVALALGLSPEMTKLELIRAAARKMKSARRIPPRHVESGPVMEHVLRGKDVDLFRFPVPRSHEGDGGRYIGTGDLVINADPDTGFVNMGTYRIQVHEPDLLGLWMSPGQQGRLICRRFWEQGKSCPVVATFGQHPLLFMVANRKIPWGQSELDLVGGLRGRPLDVVPGPVTGLPIPAHAEIAVEGEVPPPTAEARTEGPYGEWPGYYSGGSLGTGEPQPVIRVKAVYYRNDPILQNEPPLWPGAPRVDPNLGVGILWDQLESAGVPDVTGVYSFSPYLYVVAIRQRYPGHAKQAGLAVTAAAASARNGRYVAVVDDDIDPTDLKEVLWAMMTRVDPATDIDIIDGCWSTPLDPRMSPEKRAKRDYTNSRAIFYAVRPFEWMDRFPQVSRSKRKAREEVIEKYQDVIPFPKP